MAPKILVVDDDPALREMMSLSLRKEGFDVTAASTARDAERVLLERPFDLVVSDIYLGDGTGLDLLEAGQRRSPATRFILVTAHGTVETAASAHRSGVFDYLAKPFTIDTLVERVRASLATHEAPSHDVQEGPESLIIGNHPAIVEVYKAVARVAPLPIPVLVRGETGTGKELIARALHRFGASPDAPFVAVNCSAIPESLMESELFGHRKGAFTGAQRDHRGAIERARGGTIFLDEIGELAPAVQVKLLRFLQSGEVQPVGADSSAHVPTRVVAATHRDLRHEVATGSFREDFYYRLAAYEITLPPLRHRRSDLPFLVEHFRTKHQEHLGLAQVSGPSEDMLRLLQAHHWPGNVRELENLVQRAIVDVGNLADAAAIRRLLTPVVEDEAGRPPHAIGDDLTLKEVERLHIEAVLRRVRGNRTRAAAILGIERKTLYRKAGRLGIHLDGQEDS